MSSASTISSPAVEQLRDQMRGQVVEPGDEAYEHARRVYNGMIDKRPRLVARCRDVADVMAAVRFAHDHGLLVAVRGGGHNGAGLGTCDEGMVIDLGPMRGIRVDPHARTVQAEAGCRQGDMDHATHPFGLAVPAGVVSTTGVAGLTLGGGHGYLSRSFGLTIDNLLAADVVLADGTLVTASAEQAPDLFWAVRGGGGNFGIVTSFLFRAQPVHTVVAGPMFWSLEDTAEMLRWYRDFMPAAPRELYGFAATLNVPPAPPFPEQLHLQTVCGIVWCFTGPPERADEALRPARQFRQPLWEHIGPMPFPVLQSIFDPLFPPGLQWYWKGDFFRTLPDEAIERHLEFGSRLPSPLSQMHLYPVDGRVHDVGRSETAFAYRDVNWSMVIAAIDPDPANAERITTWAKDYWNALHPYSAGGAYSNFMMAEGEEGQDRVRATYGDNYARLVEVKTKYDPDNFFRVNQNIRPAK